MIWMLILLAATYLIIGGYLATIDVLRALETGNQVHYTKVALIWLIFALVSPVIIFSLGIFVASYSVLDRLERLLDWGFE